MATADRFPKAPPLRFELTEDQAAALDAAKPPGDAALIVGYAQRHPWPAPDRFTLCAWFVSKEDTEAALMAGGIMAKTPRKKARRGKGVSTADTPRDR